MRLGDKRKEGEMKKILIEQCLQCDSYDGENIRCRELGIKLMNPYQIPTDCPLEDEVESKWLEKIEIIPTLIRSTMVFGLRKFVIEGESLDLLMNTFGLTCKNCKTRIGEECDYDGHEVFDEDWCTGISINHEKDTD